MARQKWHFEAERAFRCLRGSVGINYTVVQARSVERLCDRGSYTPYSLVCGVAHTKTAHCVPTIK